VVRFRLAARALISGDVVLSFSYLFSILLFERKMGRKKRKSKAREKKASSSTRGE
jgi:hypothetical protein